MKIYPVLLCGGSGTRLWPLSRDAHPKQYLKLASRETLLQQTALRLQGLDDAAPAIVVTHHAQRFLVAEQLHEAGVAPLTVMLEPVARNTAPAIAAAAHRALHEQADALLLVLPSDHLIQNEAAFARLVQAATPLARDGYLVTFGIEPTQPHTGYGYLCAGPAVKPGSAAHEVRAFIEKPDAEHAARLLAHGGYYWNSGMFLMKASTWLAELQHYAPEIARHAELAWQHARHDDDFIRLEAGAFGACPSLSADYAVMEQTHRAVLLPADGLGWSDVGSWEALAQLAAPDAAGNTTTGDVLTESLSNSYIRAEHRLVAAIGLDNVVIVETADAVLVAHRERTQDVRKIVARLEADGRSEARTQRRVARPWGSYETLERGERYQVKRIVVNPGARLSLQMHRHRAEHWVVVKGTAHVTNGAHDFVLQENQSCYIPAGVVHRLSNPGQTALELIEVQSGAYLGEDDIVRFEDCYGRAGEMPPVAVESVE
ncbi:mannose-1-phosphate guanylyltransferase/mannose-6-phosphate isomerase [Paraburkholderia bonniea]|uniref:mannose-1-phosphate guanylyltransferase/mannose-6-phosphate isomerase n=1 Tax=Paraburkholderia bonniea TaxID=2152891 RepID=UPI0012913FAE|nr:mannose-1-phosphate guanylyltransferase/mannose-6-phosphate isomerase [Paraburkholderia bonniea]